MRTSNKDRDSIVLLVIKVSALVTLCLMLLNTLMVFAQPMPVWKRLGTDREMQEKVRQIYSSQIGIRENPSNSGPQVEKYLRYVHLPKGNPWCAAFVCWVFGEAGVVNPRIGWSPHLFEDRHVIWDREQGTRSKEQRLPQSVKSAYPPRLTTNNQQPTTSDIFGLYFPEKKRIAHVGFIDQWDGTWLVSVEGNTNVSGSREGDGVYRKRRLVRTIFKVARYVNP